MNLFNPKTAASLVTILLLTSCNKDDIVEPFNPSMIVGSTYNITGHSIEFLSEDSLIYTNTNYKDFQVNFKTKYTLQKDKLSFSGKDTIRIDYKDPITDREHFMRYYCYGSFKGYFKKAEELEATELKSGFNSYSEDENFVSTSSNTLRGVILRKEL